MNNPEPAMKHIPAAGIDPAELATLLDLALTFEPGELRTFLEALVIGIANGRDQVLAIGMPDRTH
ncbi:hypothetical protein ACFYY5_29015 [Nocardia elegans]|uniref:Uncharacterized protein n=1 Tax=Nocardia elegans TaxID=300029 RepID=A0ABW6TL82_9NOCA